MRKELGKIQSVRFGRGGYQDSQFGLFLNLEGKSMGVSASTDHAFWDTSIKITENTKWSEEDRSKHYANEMRHLSGLLNQAKVSDVSKLVGKPVEMTFEGNLLKSWRILTEVL